MAPWRHALYLNKKQQQQQQQQKKPKEKQKRSLYDSNSRYQYLRCDFEKILERTHM